MSAGSASRQDLILLGLTSFAQQGEERRPPTRVIYGLAKFNSARVWPTDPNMLDILWAEEAPVLALWTTTGGQAHRQLRTHFLSTRGVAFDLCRLC